MFKKMDSKSDLEWTKQGFEASRVGIDDLLQKFANMRNSLNEVETF